LSISSGGNLLYIPVERETLFRVSLGSGWFSSGDFRVPLRCGGLARDFSMMGEELIATFPPWYKSDIPD
jgi:hypothetical protein